MKVVNTEPPEWIMKGCLDKFRVNVAQTFWTYGDTVFNPGGGAMPDHILAHESQHAIQQTWEYMEKYLPPQHRTAAMMENREAKDFWWQEFLSNPRFRLEQEAEAYGAQYRFFCSKERDRNRRAMFLMQIAGHLSGPLYQVAISPIKARQLIEVLAGERQLA